MAKKWLSYGRETYALILRVQAKFSLILHITRTNIITSEWKLTQLFFYMVSNVCKSFRSLASSYTSGSCREKLSNLALPNFFEKIIFEPELWNFVGWQILVSWISGWLFLKLAKNGRVMDKKRMLIYGRKPNLALFCI